MTPPPLDIHGTYDPRVEAVLGLAVLALGLLGLGGIGWMIWPDPFAATDAVWLLFLASLSCVFLGAFFAWKGLSGRHVPRILARVEAAGLTIRPFGALRWSEVERVSAKGSGRDLRLHIKPRKRQELGRSLVLGRADCSLDDVIAAIIAHAAAAGVTVRDEQKPAALAMRCVWHFVPDDPGNIPRETRPGFIHD